MDTEALLMMMKGALVPTIVIAISQSSAVANVTTTTGYLAALISVSAQCLQPRAKFMKVMFFCLLSLCVTASITCLAIYTAVKARDPKSDERDDLYDSSASAVAAIWLFVMIWVGNALRAWRMAELQDPIVASSIFAVVVLTRAGNWSSTGDGFLFIARVIKTFLIGFGVAAGVSLFILPRTCRGGVFDDIRGFVKETNAVLESLAEFVNTASRTNFLTRQKTHLSEDEQQQPSDSRFASARSHLTRASNTLNALDAKLQADLKYSRNEVAWGKLSATDLDEMSVLLRDVLLPLSGMSLLPVIVDSFAEAESRLQPSGLASSSSTIQEQAPIDNSIDALAQCLGDTKTLVGAGLQYFLLRLELTGKSPFKRRPSDVEAATREFAPMGLDVSSPDFASSFQLKTKEMAAAKEKLRADGFLVRGSTPSSQHENSDGDLDTNMVIHQDFLLVLYLFNLQTMVLDATLSLIAFAKRKMDDGTMKRWRLLGPGHHLSPRSRKEKKGTPRGSEEAEDMDRNVQGLEVVDLVHLKPANFLERGSDWFRPAAHLVGSDLSKFGLRVAAASLSIGIVAFLHQTHEWFIRQRGVWAMIVVVIGMSPTSGQSFFGFFARIMATIVALALSLVAWYVVNRHTPGVIILLFVANVIEYYTYIKKPHLFGPSIIAIVTLNIIIAYELQVKKLGIAVAESAGQPYYPIYEFGPYKLAAVAVGCAVSFFWTIFPYPITAKSKVPALAGGSLFNLARYYSATHAAVDSWIHKGHESSTVTHPSQEHTHLRHLLRDFYKQELLALNRLRMHSHFATYEPPIGGKFPSAIYGALTAGMQRILTILSLMAHMAQTMPAPSFQKLGAQPSDWPSHHLAAAWASTDFQFQATTSLFCHLASSLAHAAPLPPFLAVSETFPLMRHLHKINSEMLQMQHSYQPAFTAFISLELLRTVLSLELQKQIE
ncbi:hypothetical protein B0T10DRAFT_532842 [Thelonectria olida]|uniref:ER transporter 6TM N-terminal domain-containing protein n=1 Tax=Thelonectria olida TaxID=1576542 RepID=A0A9P8VTE4_9HYPO|nr:hypothetical protein B0T10DRAFT_532842 [Thelonectria olida]